MSARLERTLFNPATPEYDYRSREWTWTPERIKRSFTTFPLGRRYVDWLAREEYQIISRPLEVTARLNSPIREIWIKNDIPVEKQKEAIVHEIFHIAIPHATNLVPNPEIEEAIDEISLPYSQDERFMNYLLNKVPYFCRLAKRDSDTTVRSISDRYDIQYID